MFKQCLHFEGFMSHHIMPTPGFSSGIYMTVNVKLECHVTQTRTDLSFCHPFLWIKTLEVTTF